MTGIAGTDNQAIEVIGGEALGAEEHWTGIQVKPDDLDPSGADSRIRGLAINLSGVDTTNVPENLAGIRIIMPSDLSGLARYNTEALYISEGDIEHYFTVPNTAATSFTAYDMVIDASNLVASSEIHAFDVALANGAPSGTVAAIGTHTDIDPIHQHIGSFTSPSQTEYAGRKTGGGSTWADGIDTNEIFIVNSDEVYIGSNAQYSQIEVIMTTPGTKTISPTFWYNTAADIWTQFYPADDTDGFQNSGLIKWDLSGITALWTNDGDPGVGDSSAGYWIKIIRTANPDPGTPTPTTMKTGTITQYEWNSSGDLTVHDIDANDIDAASLILDTALSPAEGGTGVANNAANTLTFTGAYSLGLTLTANTVLTAPTEGTLYGTKADSITSANLAGSLSDETGTGAAVFGTSPTFTTQITTPKVLFDDGQGIYALDGNEQLLFGETASAVNYLKATNSATGENILLEATGSDTNVSLDIKGTGEVNVLSNLNVIPESQYPPAQSDTYVKATTRYDSEDHYPHFTTDPAKTLTGGWVNNQWLAILNTTTDQRFHIDLGSAKIVKRIYYENAHSSGTVTDVGVQNFTFWGSNTAGSFAELTYATDTGWTQLTTSQATFDEHAAADAADPKYITVTNTTAYRYYAFKFADNWGYANLMGIRRIELQTAGEVTTSTLIVDGGIGALPQIILAEGGTTKWKVYNDPADDDLQIYSGATLRYEFDTAGTANADVAWGTFSPVVEGVGKELLAIALEDANKPVKPYEGIPVVKTDDELFDMLPKTYEVKVAKVDEEGEPVLADGKPIMQTVTRIERDNKGNPVREKVYRPRKANEFATEAEKQIEYDKYHKVPAKIAIANAKYLEYLTGVIDAMQEKIDELESRIEVLENPTIEPISK